MANNLKCNPMFLDTAGATSTITGPVVITSIIFKSTTAGDQCLIKDSDDDDILFDVTVSANAQSVVWTPSVPLVSSNGLTLKTITHGSVLIYS